MNRNELDCTNTALTLVLEAAQQAGFDINTICNKAIALNQTSRNRTGVDHQPQIEKEIQGSLDILMSA
jgi:hypothetical protein